MGLNKQKGNMYGFVTHTWNTVKGKCYHDCSYCYMKRFGKQNPVRFDESELKTNLGSGNFIFVGSSNDMFAADVPDEWILKTLNYCDRYYKNKYLFQTKNPARMHSYQSQIPAFRVLCTTIESDIESNNVSVAPSFDERLYAVDMMEWMELETMITIEPIMKFSPTFARKLRTTGCKRINIGANSSRVELPEPTPEELRDLISELKDHGVNVYLKDNLKRLLK